MVQGGNVGTYKDECNKKASIYLLDIYISNSFSKENWKLIRYNIGDANFLNFTSGCT